MLGGPYRPAASLGEHIGLRAGTPLAAPLAAGVVGAELIRMRQIASGIDFTGASDEDVMRIWLLRHFLGGQVEGLPIPGGQGVLRGREILPPLRNGLTQDL